MKIINNGRGIHVREIPGIESFQKSLPNDWLAFTNLDIALPGKGVREIDVIIVLDDRLLLVDLKDWRGPISSQNGHWFNGEYDNGRSPVAKLSEIARDLLPLLKRFLTSQFKNSGGMANVTMPYINTAVVLTKTKDRSKIAEIEVSSVFDIESFIRTIQNKQQRIQTFGPRAHENFISDAWLNRFSQFFNVNDSRGIFLRGKRRYGGFTAKVESHTFQHDAGLYAEFDVEETDTNNSFGLLRRWDFTMADTRFQTEEGRAEIVGREREVIAWLDDRNQKCGETILKPKAEDTERGVAYWEVFERRRRMKRLSDFARTELIALTNGERIELARQVLSAVAPIHALKVAHLNLGSHSVWLERPTAVKLSHLMVASLPEVQTLGESRYQFLSSTRSPEEILDEKFDPLRKDVFTLGCVVHILMFGLPPDGEPPEWHPEKDSSNTFGKLHGWFEKGLAFDQRNRFADAGDMLAGFNKAFESIIDERTTIEGLERFRTLPNQMAVFREYAQTEFIREDQRVIIWRSDTHHQSRLIKLWHGSALGNIKKEHARILAFLENVQQLVESPPQGTAKLLNVHWTGDAIVATQEFVAGITLAEYIDNGSFAEESEMLDFIVVLVDTISNLHDRSIAHGDVKPDNIVVDDSQGHPLPVLIDLVDFSSQQDGSRSSRAYCPVSGGRFERDRFAVTKIVEELVESGKVSSAISQRILVAVDICRTAEPANGSLLPLREEIEKLKNIPAVETLVEYCVSLVHTDSGLIHPDEGLYWIVKNLRGIRIIGAVEELSVELGSDGMPKKAWRNKLDHGQARRLDHQKICSFRALISTQEGPNHLDDIAAILELPEVASTLVANTGVTTQTEEDSEPTQIESIDAGVDDLVTREVDEKTDSSTSVDVPTLWERFIRVEGDFKTEAIALDDSVYREAMHAHLVPIQLTLGDLDYDRSDTVGLERFDNKGGWRWVGNLDLQKSSPSDLVFQGYGNAYGGANIREGDRLRFQSRLENVSWQRREEATTRILRGNSVALGLLDAFNPKSELLPMRLPVEADEETIHKRYGLNATQVDAFKDILASRPLGLLRGPPGTGKTRFIGALVHYALTHGLARNVLVSSQSHEAVNNAAEAVLNLFGTDRDRLSMIRVGAQGQVSELLSPYHVEVVEKAYKDNFFATRQTRITEVAIYLGLDKAVCDLVMYFEDTIRPILNRILELSEREENIPRITSLKETLEQCLSAKDVTCNLQDVMSVDIGEEVTSRYFARLPAEQAHLIERLRNVVELGRDIVGTVSNRQRSYETFLAGTRQVVAGTCVGLGRSSLGLTKTPFDLVIVDEAARCTPSELAVPIQAGKWIVLVGDQAQLEPVHSATIVNALANELHLPLGEIVKSDFERVFQSAYGIKAGQTLRKQYRMLPPIGRLVSNAFYDSALQHGRTDSLIPEGVLPSELKLPLVWVSTDSMGEDAYQTKNETRQGSLQNAAEADTIVSLLKKWSKHEPFLDWVKSQTGDTEIVGVICGYSAQLELINRKLKSESFPEVFRRAIKVGTIDSYQGKENLIVMLSLVRNNAEGARSRERQTISPGFMAKKNRINVALSRAMDRLIIVGAKSGWREGTPVGLVSVGFDEEVKAGDALFLDAKELMSSKTVGAKRNVPLKEQSIQTQGMSFK